MKSVIVCLPGILARCQEQHGALRLETAADTVVYYDYDQRHFNGFAEARRAAGYVARELQNGSRVTILGTSIGGDLAPFVFSELISNKVDISNLRVRVVDAPVGVESFLPMPGFLKKPDLITSNFGTALGTLIGGGSMLANKLGVGLPKDDYITMPNDKPHAMWMVDHPMSLPEWRKHIKGEAKRMMSGHRPVVWAQQIQWMTMIGGSDGSLSDNVRAMADRGMDVRYIMCTDGNDTVDQPMAKNWWTDRIGQSNFDEVAAPHCGYLQMRDQFGDVLLPLLW